MAPFCSNIQTGTGTCAPSIRFAHCAVDRIQATTANFILQLDCCTNCHLQELLYCGSAGLACLVAQAMPETYLEMHNELPPTELELDFGGEIQINRVSDVDGFATIDVGGELM